MCKGEFSAVIAQLMCKFCEEGVSGREELEMASLFPFPCCSVNCEYHVKENPDRKKKKKLTLKAPHVLYRFIFKLN